MRTRSSCRRRQHLLTSFVSVFYCSLRTPFKYYSIPGTWYPVYMRVYEIRPGYDVGTFVGRYTIGLLSWLDFKISTAGGPFVDFSCTKRHRILPRLTPGTNECSEGIAVKPAFSRQNNCLLPMQNASICPTKCEYLSNIMRVFVKHNARICQTKCEYLSYELPVFVAPKCAVRKGSNEIAIIDRKKPFLLTRIALPLLDYG